MLLVTTMSVSTTPTPTPNKTMIKCGDIYVNKGTLAGVSACYIRENEARFEVVISTKNLVEYVLTSFDYRKPAEDWMNDFAEYSLPNYVRTIL